MNVGFAVGTDFLTHWINTTYSVELIGESPRNTV